jgi:autotransporter adhesin
LASGSASTAGGQGAVASGNNSTSYGQNALATGANTTVVGQSARASNVNTVAVGAGAAATAPNSAAYGTNAFAYAQNSVALGNDAIANRPNTVSVGYAGGERQITNVADGTAPTDAVNVRQLTKVASGVAMATAMGGAAGDPNKDYSISLGSGWFQNQLGTALTMQARLAPWAVTSASVAYGMQSAEFAGRAGLTVSW